MANSSSLDAWLGLSAIGVHMAATTIAVSQIDTLRPTQRQLVMSQN